jgi:hypothetical protein
MHINGQPASFWRCSDVFRIPTGTNEARAAYPDHTEILGYESLTFVVAPGGACALVRKREPSLVSPLRATGDAWVIHDRLDRVLVKQTDATGLIRIVAEAAREEYVFGVSSAAAATAGYRGRNP